LIQYYFNIALFNKQIHMQNRSTENQARISELARLIEELSSELNQLLTIEDEEVPQTVRNIVTRTNFRVGDTVEITNEYRNQLGERGTVTKVTRTQVAIRLLSSGRTIRKKKTNVTLVEPVTTDQEQ
jgi:ABC-type Zn uptake system ZnuABC Zn-binding protein ZnuA